MSEIAIVGLSCRLPGASSPDEFWALLRDGKEGIGEAPADARPGHRARRLPRRRRGLRRGPSSASPPARRRRWTRSSGSRSSSAGKASRTPALGREPGTVGVFVGVDGLRLRPRAGRGRPGRVGHHTMPGQGRALIANRISYALGLAGPSLTVDTGQSSSLVAVHLACQSLRERECERRPGGRREPDPVAALEPRDDRVRRALPRRPLLRVGRARQRPRPRRGRRHRRAQAPAGRAGRGRPHLRRDPRQRPVDRAARAGSPCPAPTRSAPRSAPRSPARA